MRIPVNIIDKILFHQKHASLWGQEFCSFGHVHQDESENFYHVLVIDAYTDVMGLSA